MKKLNLGAEPDIKKGFDTRDYKKFNGVNLVFYSNLKNWPSGKILAIL